MLECLCCHGQYPPTQSDGTEYYHVCPTLSGAEIAAGVKSAAIVLAPADQARLDAAKALDVSDPVPKDSPTREQQVYATLIVARPGARDENIDAAKARATLRDNPAAAKRPFEPTMQKAPGAGARVVQVSSGL